MSDVTAEYAEFSSEIIHSLAPASFLCRDTDFD